MANFKDMIKPCRGLGYCPYGPLVEEMPLADGEDQRGCSVFGHICPVFHCAEPFVDGGEVSDDEIEAQFKELKEFWSH
jgi:hypothetical protein